MRGVQVLVSNSKKAMIRKLPCRISEVTAYLAQQDVYQGAIGALLINTEGTNAQYTHACSGQSQAPFTRDRTNVYPDENSSGLLRLHGSAKKFVHLTFPFTRSKKFVHLTFPFTWELPEIIRKAAFRVPIQPK